MGQNITVLFSGTGTNLKAIIDRFKENTSLNITGITNNPSAKGISICEENNIPVHVINSKEFKSNLVFDKALLEVIDKSKPKLIVLAGYMKVLSDFIVDKYYGHIINIHPSILPKYKGLHTHKRALENKEKIHGTTVHFVNQNLDDGPIIAQVKLMISDDDDISSLEAKVKKQEYFLYPEVISWFLQGRVNLLDRSFARIDDNIIPKTGIIYPEQKSYIT